MALDRDAFRSMVSTIVQDWARETARGRGLDLPDTRTNRWMESLIRERLRDGLLDAPERSGLPGQTGVAEIGQNMIGPQNQIHVDGGFLAVSDDPDESQPSPVAPVLLYQSERTIELSSLRPVVPGWSFSPGIGIEVDGGEPLSWDPDQDSEAGLWTKVQNHVKLTASRHPGVQTGKLRLLSQSLLGLPLDEYDVDLFQENSVTASMDAKGLFTDPITGEYWLVDIDFTAEEVSFTPYETNEDILAAVLSARDAASMETPGSAEEVSLLKEELSAEKYALCLSTLSTEPTDVQTVSLDTTGMEGSPFAYSWRFNWDGSRAAIILDELTGSKLTVSQEGGKSDLLSRVFELTIARDAQTGAFSVTPALLESNAWRHEDGVDWRWAYNGSEYCSYVAQFWCDPGIPGDCDEAQTRDTLDPAVGHANQTPMCARYISEVDGDHRNNTLLITRYTKDILSKPFEWSDVSCGANTTYRHRNCAGAWHDWNAKRTGGTTVDWSYDDCQTIQVESSASALLFNKTTDATHSGPDLEVTLIGGANIPAPFPGLCGFTAFGPSIDNYFTCATGLGCYVERQERLVAPELYSWERIDVRYNLSWTYWDYSGMTDTFYTGSAIVFPVDNAEAVMLATRETILASGGTRRDQVMNAVYHGDRVGRVWQPQWDTEDPDGCDNATWQLLADGSQNTETESPVPKIAQPPPFFESATVTDVTGLYVDDFRIIVCGRHKNDVINADKTIEGDEPAYDKLGFWTYYQSPEEPCWDALVSVQQGVGPGMRLRIGFDPDDSKALSDGYPDECATADISIPIGDA